MNKIFLFWIIIGQVIMVLVNGDWLKFKMLEQFAISAGEIIPAIAKTDTKSMFDPEKASIYLSLLWIASPIFILALMRVEDVQFVPKKIGSDSGSLFLFLLVLSGLSLYSLNMNWEGELLIMLLSPYSFGMALLGSISVLLPVFTIRLWVCLLKSNNTKPIG